MNLILEENNIIVRFSEEDLEWCNIHESKIWKEIISLDLMYNKEYNSYTFLRPLPLLKGMLKNLLEE